MQRADRPIEHDLSERLITRGQVVAIEDRDPRRDADGADMEVDRGPLTQRSYLAGQQADARIDAIGR